LISSQVATSNGIAHEYRRLVLLYGGREVLRYDSGAFTTQKALVEKHGRCHLASAHYETVRHPIRGPALYLVERSFDPAIFEMDEELAGTRVAESERLRIPFDPLAVAPRARDGRGGRGEGWQGPRLAHGADRQGVVRMSFPGDDVEGLRVGTRGRGASIRSTSGARWRPMTYAWNRSPRVADRWISAATSSGDVCWRDETEAVRMAPSSG
jgi:hypothetical protein